MKTLNNKRLLSVIILALMGVASVAEAVPLLQVGVPNDEGGYVPYTTVGGDADTAFTSDFKIAFGGRTSTGNDGNGNFLQLGGRYEGVSPYQEHNGLDWSQMGFNSAFDGHGAIAVVSVADGLLNIAELGVTLGGATPFFATSDDIIKGDNHYPAQEWVSDFLFFDLGDFAKDAEYVPDFSTCPTSLNCPDKALGDIITKTLALTTVAAEENIEWLHFDVIALLTTDKLDKDNKLNTEFWSTALKDNPNSHDVTWTKDGGGPPTGCPAGAPGTFPDCYPAPEPSQLALLGIGLFGMGAMRKAKGLARV